MQQTKMCGTSANQSQQYFICHMRCQCSSGIRSVPRKASAKRRRYNSPFSSGYTYSTPTPLRATQASTSYVPACRYARRRQATLKHPSVPTSFGAREAMNSLKILLALTGSLLSLHFLKSSQASQNSMFSSLNSLERNTWNRASPSVRQGKSTVSQQSQPVALIKHRTRFPN